MCIFVILLESNPVAGTSGVPCTEAHILFMCLRYADHCNSEEMASNFIEGVLSTVHKMLQVIIMFISNMHADSHL